MLIVDQQTFEELAVHVSDNEIRQIESEQRFLQEIQQIIPEAEINYEIRVDEDTGYKYLHNTKVNFKRNNIVFKAYRWQKQFRFAPELSHLAYINNYSQGEAKRSLVEPNQIGVLTAKKVERWIDYYTQFYTALVGINNENKRKIDEFRAYLNTFPDVCWCDHSRGYIERNGLRYDFRIENTRYQGEVKLSSQSYDLADFEKLSDNQFRK